MELVVKYWLDEAGYDSLYNENVFCHYACKDGDFFVAHCATNKGKSYKFFKEMQDKAKELGATYITGNLDLTGLSNLGGQFAVQGNSNLTGITHAASTQVFSNNNAY